MPVQEGKLRGRAVVVSAGLALVTLLVATSPARAELSPLVFQIEVSNSAGTGTFSATVDQGVYYVQAGQYEWMLPGEVAIEDDTTHVVIATLSSASATYVDDPQVFVTFNVVAGASDTDITITSAVNSFPTIYNAVGRASAAMTLTDGDGDGATITGLGPTGGSYLAQHNGVVPGGTTFAELLGSFSADPGGSNAIAEDTPGGGAFSAIGTVIDMSAQFSFRLSANDRASGTSVFEVIPEPGSAVLLAMGVAVGWRRRRRPARRIPI